MILPNPKDAIHKAWLYRVLSGISDNTFLVAQLRFKGGTCAAMRNIIDRFSIDLDFDLLASDQVPKVQRHLEKIFNDLDLEIKDKSIRTPQYFLRYPNKHGERNTLKIYITFPPPKSNEYESVRLTEIDRVIYCHTIPTMFANKLVTIIDRFNKFGSIAGRDIYDIHTFFLKGYRYHSAIIKERTGMDDMTFFKALKNFIQKQFTQVVIDQDLNTMLPLDHFKKERKRIKQEVLMFIEDTI